MRIAIIGAGSAGLFTAWYLSRMAPDATLHIFDKGEPGQGTTWKAAGMLAPIHELEFQELELLAAGRASRSLYFNEIQPALGEIGLHGQGTLQIGLSQDDGAYLRRLFEFQQQQGLKVEWVQGNAVQDIEPFVARAIQQAIYSPEDTQIDNWLLVEKLVAQLKAQNVQFHIGWELKDFRETGEGQVELDFGHETHAFDRAVLALGVPDPQIAAKLPYKIYPVRGEMLSLSSLDQEQATTIVRIFSKVLGNAYIAPKADRILLGSTSEEMGMEMYNTAGGLLNILRKCYAAMPSVYEMKVQSTWAGLRPSTLDRLPVIGAEPGSPVYHINGLYRHGILLGPLLGKSLASLLLGNSPSKEVKPFILGHKS